MRKIFYSLLFLFAFTVASGVYAQPSPPVLTQPTDNATGVSLFPTFQWNSSSGATYYHIQVFTGVTTVIDVNSISGTSYTVTSAVLSGNTSYYWHVSAGNGSGEGSYSAFFHFTTAPAAPAPPVLVAPTNGSINVSLTPTLSWNASSGASQYQVQVSTDSNFGSTVINVTGLANPGYVVPGSTLNNNVKYYWRVNASNPGGTSLWSSVWNFKTVPALPIAPTLAAPPNGSTNQSVTLTLKWFKLPPTINYYNVVVSANSIFTQIVIDENVTDSLYAVPGGALSGSTTYYWKVRAANVAGIGDFSPYWSFTTGIAPPAAPVLITPPNGSITGITNVLFDWNSVAGAQSYRIQISTSSNFGTTFVNQVTGATSQYTHTTPAFAYNTTYYWRVNATNAGGTGAWSTVWSFTTSEAPPIAPTLVSPANNSVNIPLTPTLTWNAVSNATSYRVQVSTVNTFNSTVVNEVVTGTQYTIPSGVLQGYTVYYWRVAGINSGGQGPYSTVWNFRTVQTFNLSLKVFLEGFYNGSTQVTDTVKLYLAQSTTPYNFRDSSLAFVGADGQANIVSFSQATTGTYYIIVKHRNHLETWSANAMYFSTGNTVSYNFTDYPTKAYGNNMKQVGSVWVLYSGDINQDGAISPLDYDAFRPQFGYSGYKSADLNGDGFVDGYDLPILNSNFGNSKKRPY